MTGIQKKQRLLTMIFGAFAIFFTGYPHVWSIYQPYVMEQAGWSQGQASMCFYLALSTFVFGNIVGGRMQNRFKEKTIVWIGGGIFAAGILASAFLIVSTPLPMYLSYGVMQGFGQGMIYTVILATVQRWFPDRTGFASGVVVTANGLCGFFLAPLSRKLLEAEGVQKTFLIIGAAIAVSWILCGIFFQAPDKSLVNAGGSAAKSGTSEMKQYTSGEMMRTRNFYLLLATMFFGLISYFMVSPVSQTYQIDLGIPSAVAVSAVMIQGGFLFYGIVGNVKIAVFRNEELVPLGTGHTVDVLAQDKYVEGVLTREDALSMLQEKRIYNYLGRDGFKEIQFYDKPVRLQEGDVVAVFSNGMQESVTWKEMEDCLARKKSCKRMAFDLVELVNQKKGDKDNASVILIRVGEMT